MCPVVGFSELFFLRSFWTVLSVGHGDRYRNCRFYGFVRTDWFFSLFAKSGFSLFMGYPPWFFLFSLRPFLESGAKTIFPFEVFFENLSFLRFLTFLKKHFSPTA